MEKPDSYDVIVVGGGAAGLSGALTLARARRSVLVVDAGDPRNAPAGGVHMYLGRESTPPAALLAADREELRGYGGRVREGRAVAATRVGAEAPDAPGAPGGFRVDLEDGAALHASRLLVTTGLTDELPALPGLAACWGRDVLHCPYCHGWEVRDQPVGVLATGMAAAVHQALLWRQWTADLTLFAHTAGEPDDAAREQLAARGVAVVAGEVTRLDTTGGRLTGVVLAGGRTVPVRALAVGPRLTARSGVLTGLGLTATEQAMGDIVLGTRIAADPVTGATAQPGVWAAGNVTNLGEQVIGAAAAGVRAGAAINADLIAAEVREAVAARRQDGREPAGSMWTAGSAGTAGSAEGAGTR
ncbi:NAD(P)/FAD-dependent oxidoreductase [Streptomyces sp. V4-01]|uniref:NAD(P)/FAD-dependent oxidoreductase n=1 Tax=Actinacidiphila polyblastidii TaxID=3110430 RepID=A0ABU7PL16_9ACTN|nr:NAD(P)/FAD-dependent oxidoreductase [Streptomyces sp. V4-01]